MSEGTMLNKKYVIHMIYNSIHHCIVLSLHQSREEDVQSKTGLVALPASVEGTRVQRNCFAKLFFFFV